MRPHKIALGSAEGREVLIVRMTADNGLVGLGEAIAHPAFSGETLGALKAGVNCLAECALGENPMNLNKICTSMDHKLYANYGAKGAIETAVLDLLGRCLDTPVYNLFGGITKDRFPVSRSASHSDLEKDIAEVREYMEEGYRIIKVKVGVLSVGEDVERVKAIREVTGSKVSLRADANQGWDVPTALKFIRGVEDCGLEFLEQPVAKSNLDGMAYLRTKSLTPILADESAATEHDVLEIIKKGAADFISIKLVKSGGILAARRIATLADCAGIKCYLGSQTETSIGTAAGLHYALSANCFDYGGEIYGPAFFLKDITKSSVRIEGGDIYPSQEPGFGVELDMDRVREFAIAD
ncbi:mandelate racemase/muconate lactonizing enzyme family protein [Oleispirillum naphthae]|uniref:mandelate racemase/muconate lactonizing enzyme family protein n=1 Tax=Oleispirillum naphthae TaxID=2838853 RepID=UPI00308242C1